MTVPMAAGWRSTDSTLKAVKWTENSTPYRPAPGEWQLLSGKPIDRPKPGHTLGGLRLSLATF